MRARLAWALSLVAALLLGSVHAQESATTIISDIRQESAGDSTRLVVVSNGPLTYAHYAVDPLTVIVDLPDVDVSKLPAQIDVGSPEVESVRITPMARSEGKNLARLEVRLAHRVPYSVTSKDKTLNLVFERVGAAAEASKPGPAEAQPVAAAASAPVEAEAPASAPVSGSGAKATRILSVTHKGDASRFVVTVKADGRLRYQDFFQGNPDRLVILQRRRDAAAQERGREQRARAQGARVAVQREPEGGAHGARPCSPRPLQRGRHPRWDEGRLRRG